jgi:nicotinamidase-related amidase
MYKQENANMVENELNQALLVVDIQNDFTGQQARMPVEKSQASEIIRNINNLVGYAQHNKWVILYIGNEYSSLDPLNVFRNFAAITGSEGVKLDPKLAVINQNYFPKKKADAFSNPELLTFLKQSKINEILVTGVYAEACILQTIKGGLRNGFRVKAVADGIGTKSQKKRQSCLDKYKKLGAEVLDTNQLIHQQNTV